MRALGTRNYALLEEAIKICGSYDPKVCLTYCEERLYVSEYEEIEAFLLWVHINCRTIGHGNYEEVFRDFKEAMKKAGRFIDTGMKNKEVQIGMAVKVLKHAFISPGKIGQIIRPAFNAQTDEFMGWKVDVDGKEWICNASDLHCNLLGEE